MHYHQIDDDNGELLDVVNLCSDSCHRDWCADNGENYPGWDGAHELEFTDWCAQCGVAIGGIEDGAECQFDNVVVNRFRVDVDELCKGYGHRPRHIIQVATQ